MRVRLAVLILVAAAGLVAVPVMASARAGVVPGLTGAAAKQAAGPAAARFLELRDSAAPEPAEGTLAEAFGQLRKAQSQPFAAAAELHTTWGIDLPSSASQGLHATQSVISTGTRTTTGGDYVYAPTALPGGSACIEMTTAYTPTGPDLWAWDWCGGRDGVGKLTPMNAAFLATYTTTVDGHAAYQLDEHKTSTTANSWTAYLYNYQTKAWDTYFTSTGTYDIPQFPFGWDMFEIYTASGNYCHDLTGQAFESSSVQVFANNAWTAATSANSRVDPSPIPSGGAYDCPQLTFSVAHPNDHWLAQIGGSTTPPPSSSYEAESGTLAGQAAVRTSAGASGGALVGYVGNGTANTDRLTVSAATAGSHTVTVYYASGAARSVTLTVNGATGPTVSTPSTGGWDTVGSVTTTVILAAGSNTIQLGNATGWAPDLDRIVVN